MERPAYFIPTRRERIISFGQRNAEIIRRVLLDTAETGMTEGIIPLMSVPDADPIVGVSRLSIIRSLAESQAIKKGIPVSDVDHAMEIAIAIHDAYGRLAVDQMVVATDIAAQIRGQLFAEGLLRAPIEKAPVIKSWADYARGRLPKGQNRFHVNGGRNPISHLRSIT
ncbi:hypothetical protein A3H85_00775 [Candidatus Daviesbacteria bacterium RIFCSPLOWO2_02_FULL_40_8]|uniref:Uncharacterized protein n=1 Tax=Candidatus Daviesbacteria bacterium RIFCSPLOWO2_01_FULL_40_24 TaxID=1797787 RepID=A0A1F5MJR5_9BACT|nr:MAG: hypothetical protein A2780_01780 [Candidatus Daviesbacteria bacterium RIFCSPHIGHO2_01_FULL_41_45]OGE35368.1 MAG: hypothetical protein A3C32_01800 [Candidatus Daviesbacteria bacterium RIFCSPHIGHO2_02_FULL_41_14]OGE65611.1 MAG: hypothetical protein A3B49_02900 [Candidatus Daviesbacteria bacterium RIFCSPLOWO2_01_FULL_40_24]OGE67056.1 MAG: hypothetical protein A3H85_00775 [Candidatus Daviesbacteria bacterium RIFCSPLOWO2_02_FULL_40_8]